MRTKQYVGLKTQNYTPSTLQSHCNYYEAPVLMDKGHLNDYQSGFRTHHITLTALLKITNDLLIATNVRVVSLLELLDFSKSFDSVNHNILCSKFGSSQFGFTTSTVSLIMSYLSDRSQDVCRRMVLYQLFFP
jgi:hypothetical protein